MCGGKLRLKRRQAQPPWHLQDFVVEALIERTPFTPPDVLHTHCFYPVIDRLVDEMKRHFSTEVDGCRWPLLHVNAASLVSVASRNIYGTVVMPKTATWPWWPSTNRRWRLWMSSVSLICLLPTTTTGGLCSFENFSGEFEYIFNKRVDLETVLTLSRFVWPRLLFQALSHCGLGSLSSLFELICCWCVLTLKTLWSG